MSNARGVGGCNNLSKLEELGATHIGVVFENVETIIIPIEWVRITEWEESVSNSEGLGLDRFKCEVNIVEYNKISMVSKNRGYYDDNKINTFTGKMYAEGSPIILGRLVSNLNTPNIESLKILKSESVNGSISGVRDVKELYEYRLPYNSGIKTDRLLDEGINLNANMYYKDKDTLVIEVYKGVDNNNIYNDSNQIDIGLINYIGIEYKDGYKLYIDKSYYKGLSVNVSDREVRIDKGELIGKIDELDFELDKDKLDGGNILSKGEGEYIDIDNFYKMYTDTIKLSKYSDNFTKDLLKTIIMKNNYRCGYGCGCGINYLLIGADKGGKTYKFILEDSIDIFKLFKV